MAPLPPEIQRLPKPLQQAYLAQRQGEHARAENILRDYLTRNPSDVNALSLRAEAAIAAGRAEDGECFLARCVALVPDVAGIRHRHAAVLMQNGKPAQALEQIAVLLQSDPKNMAYRSMQAQLLGRVGEHDKAMACHRALLADFPDRPGLWMNYAGALRYEGQIDDSIAAYRRALALRPEFGELYWEMANLKTFRFADSDVAAMRVLSGRSDLPPVTQSAVNFALGKAMEDARNFAEAFRHYATANALRRAALAYSADETSRFFERLKRVCTADLFRRIGGAGCLSAEPIFVVGMPRAGSTLVEQILASHSAIEGTRELPLVANIVRELGPAYPECLGSIEAGVLESLGRRYLDGARVYRHAGKAFFIDKMPHNFVHTGLIHAMLPKARIIDVRRNPLACCFSCYGQSFGRDFPFSYDLAELGRYYADYVGLMAHYDGVLPGKVLRVIYEDVVRNPEEQIRRILDWLELRFENECLTFHRTERAVWTASAQQVRQPLYSDAVEHWRNFEPWLGPLKEALGHAPDGYSEAPATS